MYQSFNRTDTGPLRLAQMPHRLLRSVAWLLLGLLSLCTLYQAQQPGLDVQLESLAAAYQENETPSNHARLLAFCHQNSARQAALGFFVLGYRDFEDLKFSEAKAYLEQ